MGCSTCFTNDFNIVSLMTFPESTTQSLLLLPGVPVSNTVAMYDSELGAHTAPSHLPVTVHFYSSADFHSGGTGSLTTSVSIQVSMIFILHTW